jgi:hypothetical protein
MVTVSVALSEVVVVGLNFTPIVHEELPARDELQVPPVIVKSGPLGPLMELPTESVKGE